MRTRRKKAEENRFDKTTMDILPIRYYDEELEAFVLKDDLCMDLLEVILKDRVNTSEDEVEYAILTLAKFYKVYSSSVKWIALNFPVDTHIQRANKLKILERTNDPVRRKWIERQISEMEKIDANAQKRESYLQIFGQGKDQFIKNRNKVKAEIGRGRGNIVKEISKEKKFMVIHKLSNMSSIVRAQEDEEAYYE